MSLFLFDAVLHFGLQALVAVDVSFLPCLPCILFSTDGLLDEGVYPGVAVPCCRGFGRDSLLNAHDCFLEICPELIYGSAWCGICCKGICIFLQVLSDGVYIGSLPEEQLSSWGFTSGGGGGVSDVS